MEVQQHRIAYVVYSKVFERIWLWRGGTDERFGPSTTSAVPEDQWLLRDGNTIKYMSSEFCYWENTLSTIRGLVPLESRCSEKGPALDSPTPHMHFGSRLLAPTRNADVWGIECVDIGQIKGRCKKLTLGPSL